MYSRDSTVYEAIQRVYRGAVVAHIRARMTDVHADKATDAMRRCFEATEWTEMANAAEQSRAAGAIKTKAVDEFDLLDVTRFANVIEKHFDLLFPGRADELPRFRSSRRQQILSLARLVRNVRDPISHPVEEEISLADAKFLIDAALRLVEAFNDKAAERLRAVEDALDAEGAPIPDSETRRLLDTLPPELKIRRFVGRKSELSELWDWFRDTDQDRWLLAGEGGRGKSAIAHEFARRIRDNAPEPLAAVVWLSAKRRALVERQVVTLESVAVTDIASALNATIDGLGFLNEAPEGIVERRAFTQRLLADFPALIVLDDVDSLEGSDEEVLEYFTRVAYTTASKLLLTSRRELAGLGSITTLLAGLDEADGTAFLDAKIDEFRLDRNRFPDYTRRRILEVTEGNPLFMEDLLRLTLTGMAVESAIAEWKGKKGDTAREYALGREVDFLSTSARHVLIAAALPTQPVSRERNCGLSQV